MSLLDHWDPEWQLQESWSKAARDAAILARRRTHNRFEQMRPGDHHDLPGGHRVVRELAGGFSHYQTRMPGQAAPDMSRYEDLVHQAEGMDIPTLMDHLDRFHALFTPGGPPPTSAAVRHALG